MLQIFLKFSDSFKIFPLNYFKQLKMSRPLRAIGAIEPMNVMECFDWERLKPTTNCPLPGLFVEVNFVSTVDSRYCVLVGVV
jgi:hypothetical protein